MKTKPFIDTEDIILNPERSFSKKIPFFYPCETIEHGHMNYGVFRAVQYANRKADGIIRAITIYFGDGEGKDEAEKELREVVKKYTENE
jgi:hypothetical protein